MDKGFLNPILSVRRFFFAWKCCNSQRILHGELKEQIRPPLLNGRHSTNNATCSHAQHEGAKGEKLVSVCKAAIDFHPIQPASGSGMISNSLFSEQNALEAGGG